MGDSEDPLGINDKIEILSTDDDRIKAVGELLSSDSSRAILKLLFNESMTANQIAQKTEISLPLVIYHLKKMQETGVVKIASTGKNTKSHDMKYYTIDKFAIVILPSGMSEKAKSSKSLHNSFNRIYRFATIGGAAIAAWFSSQFIQQGEHVAIDQTPQNTMMMKSGEQLREAAPALKTVPAPEAPTTAPTEAPPSGVESGTGLGDNSFDTSQVPQQMPGAEHMPYAAPNVIPTGEPNIDIYISVIVVLGVVVVGLIIERILRARRK